VQRNTIILNADPYYYGEVPLKLILIFALFIIFSCSHGHKEKTAAIKDTALDTTKYGHITFDSVLQLPEKADSILFIKSGLGVKPDDTLNKLIGNNAIDDLRKGIIAIIDTGVGFTPAKGDTADLSLVIYAPNESAHRVITLARHYIVEPVSKITTLTIIGVSLQYSVDSFSWIKLGDGFSKSLTDIYNANIYRELKAKKTGNI
jgi:hypothetical protein